MEWLFSGLFCASNTKVRIHFQLLFPYSLLVVTAQQSEEKIAEIIAASDLLERASFKDFWARTKAQSAIYTSVPGFEDAVRECMYCCSHQIPRLICNMG
jgi:hypothetical protein